MFKPLFNKAGGLKPVFLLKNRFQRRCFSMNIAKFLRTAFLWITFCSFYFYMMIEIFGRLWVQNWRVSYFLYYCFVFLHNSSVRIETPYLFRACFYITIFSKRDFRTHWNVGSSTILTEWLKTRNNCRTLATSASNLLWKTWIWVFWISFFYYYFSLEAVLLSWLKITQPKYKSMYIFRRHWGISQRENSQKSAKFNRPTWKLTEECKVYRYKIAKIDLN